MAPGVYGLPGVPSSFEQRVWTGWLAVGSDAIVSHEAAAQLHGIPNVVRGRVTLINPHGWHHRLADVTVHQLDDVLFEHRAELKRLPITSVARTIVDLATVVSQARLLHIVEESRRRKLTTYADVGECLLSVARRGKPGVRKLMRVLDTLTNERAVSGSDLETALLGVLDRAGLPRPVPQLAHPGRVFTRGCVDFAYVDAKLIIEADGRSWHTRIKDIRRDHERDADAAREGWLTLRLLYENIVGDSEGTGEIVRDVLRTRLAQLGQ